MAVPVVRWGGRGRGTRWVWPFGRAARVVTATTWRRRRRSGNCRRQRRVGVNQGDANKVAVGRVTAKHVDLTPQGLALDHGKVLLESVLGEVGLVDAHNREAEAVEEEVGAQNGKITSEGQGSAVGHEGSTSNHRVEGPVMLVPVGQDGLQVGTERGVGLHVVEPKGTTRICRSGEGSVAVGRV